MANVSEKIIRQDIKKTPRYGRNSSGFTLIELMIVVMIIGILVAFAFPAYQDSVRKSRRADAKGKLGEVASRMEQFYMDRKTYDTGGSKDLTEVGYSTVTVKSQEEYYTVDIFSESATTYTLRAVPTAKGNQDQDTVCNDMRLDNRGAKTPSACW